MFCVLIEYHPMLGVDFHFDLVPAVPPAPTPFEPHGVGALMNWILPASFAPTVLDIYGRVMQRGTDIMNGIPHIPMGPGVLLSPMETAFSGSKSEFGPASVQAGGKPIAAAILVIYNLNLNCGTIPTPTGIVMPPNTVVCGMTWGDILGGIMAMAWDCATQTLMNILLAPLGPLGSGIAGALLGSPLGFSFNANGHGAVGAVGRGLGYMSDFVRGAGETLGGDANGHADQQAALDAAKNDFTTPVDPNNPLSGWNVFGKDGDVGRIFQAPLPLRPFTSGAVQNPLAEHF
jgi:hypothetical protein